MKNIWTSSSRPGIPILFMSLSCHSRISHVVQFGSWFCCGCHSWRERNSYLPMKAFDDCDGRREWQDYLTRWQLSFPMVDTPCFLAIRSSSLVLPSSNSLLLSSSKPTFHVSNAISTDHCDDIALWSGLLPNLCSQSQLKFSWCEFDLALKAEFLFKESG